MEAPLAIELPRMQVPPACARDTAADAAVLYIYINWKNVYYFRLYVYLAMMLKINYICGHSIYRVAAAAAALTRDR